MQKRVFPELHVAVGRIEAGDGRSLTAVAKRATDLVEFVLREIKTPVGVRTERLGRILEARPVDAQVTGLAPFHLHHGFVEVVALIFAQDELADLIGTGGDAFQPPLLGGNVAGYFSPRRLERFQLFFLGLNLCLYRVSVGFGLLRDGRYLIEEGLGLVDFGLLGFFVMSLPDGFLEIEVGLIEKRFSEAKLLHFLESVEFALREFCFQLLEFFVAREFLFLRGDFLVEFGDRGAGGFLESVEFFLYLGFFIGVELFLVLFPGSARKRLVPDGPERHRDHEEAQDEKRNRTGFFFRRFEVSALHLEKTLPHRHFERKFRVSWLKSG